ncbi:MAG TPA: VWA domain-containing protein [Pyrinomonadaceae bacterium]|nr:VWA domain-containing protein [Pyrinomonadaceae bacterium]
MFSPTSRPVFSIILVLVIAVAAAFAQTRPASQKTKLPQPTATPPNEPQDVETLKIDTDLVTVPLIATDRAGMYVTDLRKEEFTITEDDVAQEIAFFGKVAAPFHVVLLLDTSSSTRDKLKEIQRAANAFVDQLQPADRVKVIAFDDKVNDLNEFTSDRALLHAAIDKTKSGEGTKVYDAVEMALNTIRRINGRKAIVLFSDGMDWHSDNATFEGTVRSLDEEGVVVYPIRYETRATTEALAREQSDTITPTLPTIGVIRQPPPSGTTPPTFPGGDESSIPTSGSPKTGPWGLPTAGEILRRRREEERNRYPDPNRNPAPTGDPTERVPDPNDPRTRGPRVPGTPGSGPAPTDPRPRRGPDDSITAMLDAAYYKADSYLKSLAEKSGGRLLRADTLGSLPDAFAQIAAELRTQYMLGYYPLNKDRDDRYRKIKVATSRKNVAIRARPGYLATRAE